MFCFVIIITSVIDSLEMLTMSDGERSWGPERNESNFSAWLHRNSKADLLSL